MKNRWLGFSSSLTVGALLLLSACPIQPNVSVDVALSVSGVGNITGTPSVQFGSYAAEIGAGGWTFVSGETSTGDYAVTVAAGAYEVVVSVNCANQPTTIGCSIGASSGGITTGEAPVVTGGSGAWVVMFPGVVVPTGGGAIYVNID